MKIVFIITDPGEYSITGNVPERAATIELTPDQVGALNIHPTSYDGNGRPVCREYISKIVLHS